MRFLALVTDAHGGQGGIAKFNRDLLEAFCAYPECAEVLVLSRLAPTKLSNLHPRLTYLRQPFAGKLGFTLSAVRCCLSLSDVRLILCGHVNLLPLAALLAWILSFRQWCNRSESVVKPVLTLIIHGIEAWKQLPAQKRSFLPAVRALISVSEFSRELFLAQNRHASCPSYILPNCVDLDRFSPGPRKGELLLRYSLENHKILLTVARLSASERYKGIDEVLEIMPRLAERFPSILYIVVGDGDDRERLTKKSLDLGLAKHVVFAGRIDEHEKPDYYRLADVFVMAGWGEGFGIVYLEAAACGLPVVASKLDASREIVSKGRLGIVVDPTNPQELLQEITNLLANPSRRFQPQLDQFSTASFRAQCQNILDDLLRPVVQHP